MPQLRDSSPADLGVTVRLVTAQQILSFITDIGVVPVVRTVSAETALKAIDAIYRGGIRSAEITMTVPGAIRALEKAADQFGDKLMLGAGTVLDPETARACMLAGAQFFVTPNLRLSTIEMCKRYSKVICCGALTPTEVVTAWEAGADVIKIFPADAVGGAKYIKALRGPLPHIPMIPTGGVSIQTTPDFLRAGAVAVAAGSELVSPQLIEAGDYNEIESRSKQFLAAVASVRASK